jgi:hypothetical protein
MAGAAFLGIRGVQDNAIGLYGIDNHYNTSFYLI